MKRRELLTGLAGAAALALGAPLRAQAPRGAGATKADGRPNILWLVIEDTSAYAFGCYGNAQVKTPVIDALASRGVRFTHAWAAGPQCSPSRASIITGGFGTTYGADWHRRPVEVPGDAFFPPLLREAGYFCSNNAKTDYNARVDAASLWDESGPQASYNSPRRAQGQPFFAVFNCGATHMSRVRSLTTEGRRDFAAEGLDPKALQLPPHVPDLPEVRSDYAFHLEGVQDIDGWVEVFLEDLKAQGLDEDTIVVFCSDHGGCLPRGKGFVYNTGLQVPLVAYVPPKLRPLSPFAPGASSAQLVHLMDLGPTFLSLAGVQPPARMQGRAIMGRHAAAPRDYQFAFAANQAAHFVPSRAVSDGRFHLVRSYTPHKPHCLRNSFQWGMPSNLAWDDHALHGSPSPTHLQPYRAHAGESLFDLQADPFELEDLASRPEHAATLRRLQDALDGHLLQTRDLGLFPPSARRDGGLYQWTQDTKYPLEELLSAAKTASAPTPQDAGALLKYLQDEKPEIRFWGASGLAALAAKNPGQEAPDVLLRAASDSDAYVAAEAAHALCHMGRGKEGAAALVEAFSAGSAAAYSALETLALTAAGQDALRPHIAKLQQASVRRRGAPRPEADGEAGGEGNEEGANDWQARAILVNLGEMPVQSLYPEGQKRKGLQVNASRKPLNPRPRGRAGAAANQATARQQRKKKNTQ